MCLYWSLCRLPALRHCVSSVDGLAQGMATACSDIV